MSGLPDVGDIEGLYRLRGPSGNELNLRYLPAKRSPVYPSSINSPAPPTPLLTTASPDAIISAATIPKASGWIEGNTPGDAAHKILLRLAVSAGPQTALNHQVCFQ